MIVASNCFWDGNKATASGTKSRSGHQGQKARARASLLEQRNANLNVKDNNLREQNNYVKGVTRGDLGWAWSEMVQWGKWLQRLSEREKTQMF